MMETYIDWRDGFAALIEAVRCLSCGAKIAGLLDDKLLMAAMPNYAEVEIELDSGQRFSIPCCVSCGSQARLDDMDAWYQCCLRTMQEEDQRNRVASTAVEDWKERAATAKVVMIIRQPKSTA